MASEKVSGQPEAVTTLAVTDSKDEIGQAKSVSDIDQIENSEKDDVYNKYYDAGLQEEEARFLASFTKAEEKAIFR